MLSPRLKLLSCASGLAWLALAGCTTATVTMTTDGDAKISVVAWDHLQDDGEVLGPSPQTFEASKLKDKVLKIKATDKETQYWVFTSAQGNVIEAKATLVARPQTAQKEQKGDDTAKRNEEGMMEAAKRINSDNRILLRAYEALYSRRTSVARELATQLSQLSPRTAAPYIIIGLSYLQDGSQGQATTNFTKAKSLDPEDREIDKLLQMVQ